MTPTLVRLNRAREISRGFALVSILVSMTGLRAYGADAAPLLEFASGLPGKQVRLSWPGEMGVRYAIEKSTTLASGGTGGWAQVALVEAPGSDAVWLDPVPTTQKAFYRISQPQPEVFSISPPMLSTGGGTLLISGQLIPAGSFLVIEIPGQAPVLVALTALGNGIWQAIVSGAFDAGSSMAVVSIQTGTGTVLLTLNQPLEVTATGRALDSPPSLPPAAPTSKAKPKGTKLTVSNIGSSGNDGVEVKLRAASPGASDIDDSDYSPLGMAINEKGLPGDKKPKKTTSAKRTAAGGGIGYDDLDPEFSGSSFLSKKGYDSYKASGDMASARTVTPPYSGSSSALVKELSYSHYKHPDLMKREMGPGAITPAPSGLPGEVSFQFCALSLETPVGPPLELVHTYRSMGGGGTAMSHWEACYDISIQPVPLAAGSSAAQVRIYDGGGRSDIFRRQADGTYRCDGMFREGHFDGDTFTLTFANKGTWLFNSLSHPTASGKIFRIADPNNVALTCDYNQAGKLASVSSQFGQSLTMTYGSSGALSQVSDQQGRFVSYAYYKSGDVGGNPGDLKGISCPRTTSSPPAAGPTTFTYSTGSSDPNLNGNLLALTDGAGRQLESFTYAPTTSPTDLDYDTCVTHVRGHTTGHPWIAQREAHPPNSSPASAYTVFEVDEVGRLTETDFDALHREVAVREYTGFCIPGVPVTSVDNRPSGKLHVSDPDYFETTCAYNADSCCTRITRPDGSQELVTYDRDFRKDCPVRERANPRVMTLQTPGGEIRTVTCDYLPDFGTPESFCPGGPIKGIQVKCGRNPSPDAIAAIPGGPIKGIQVKCGNNGGTQFSIGGGLVDADDLDSDNDGYAFLKKEEGGRHTPFHNKYRPQFRSAQAGGITAGAIAGIVVARSDNDDSDSFAAASSSVTVSYPLNVTNTGGSNDSFRAARPVRIVSAYGQVSTRDYDVHGNCTSVISSLPGRGKLYQYNALGQLTTSTELNGADPSFTDTCVYNPATGFLSSVIQDSSGLHLTTSLERDDFNRVSRVVDPNGHDWLYGYNSSDTCIQGQSPPCPSRISMNLTVDGAGRPARYDIENRGADGSLDSSNPVYSTFYVRDECANLVQVATEVRPVNQPPSALAPAATDLASYDVCDVTLNGAGEVVRISIPGASRSRPADQLCDFTYNERGLLDRCIEGGLGTPGAVTTECLYDELGARVSYSTLGSGVASSETLSSHDGFHRLSSITDPMGNVIQYAYGNDGSVTTSLYGEIEDVVGSKSNLLLARCVCKSGFSGGGGIALMKAKEKANRTKCGNNLRQIDLGLFFEVETEDDVITVERFSPGSTAPTVTEVTVIDRSPAGLVQQISCNGDTLETRTHDTAGRLTGRSHSAGHYALTLDGKGCVTSSTWTALSTLAGAPPKTFTISRILDPLSRGVQATDGVGNTTHTAFDSLSRVVSETEPGGLVIHTVYDGSSSAGPFSSQVSADFDGDGNPDVIGSSLARCGELLNTTDSHGFPTLYTDDALGRCVRTDRPDGTFETCSFDSLGIRVQGTFSDGTIQNRTHDLNGRVISLEWTNVPSGIVAVAPKTMLYDGLGNLIICVQGTSAVTATYDSCGDQTSETQDGLTVSRTFNHRGRTGILYPDGKRFQESRNAFGELVSVSGVTPTGVVLSPPVVSYDYLGHQVCRSIQRNGVTTTFSYRGDGEVSPAGTEDFSFGSCIRETITDPSSAILSDALTSRDANQRTCSCPLGFSVQGQQKTRLTVTPRDVFGNISSCVISRTDSGTLPPVIESSVSYIYVLEASKRISEIRNGVQGTYTQDPSLPPGDLQMSQYSTWPGGSLTWDPNGNIQTFQKGTSQLTFVHDAEGHVVRVDDSTGHAVVGYGYNANGRRNEELHLSPTTGDLEIIIKFAYDSSLCIQEIGTDNLADMTFVCADGIRQCISTRNGTIYYPHGGASSDTEKNIQSWVKDCYDKGGLNRISLITNAAGTAVERFACDESGKPIFLTGEGSLSSATSSIIGLRWIDPDCAWQPELGMLACPGGIYSPDLGSVVSMSVSEAKPQAPSEGGRRGFFTLKPH
ncbi:MAG: hypothetical protein ABIS50_11895 [Luteolibacter sp.]|uniref:hypothetical protein n=1 Tax=Luteolibacter sp. TaxID=1962973 RepID=UPI003263E7A6